ncbi:hypothetical protein B296_00047760 [Ensete ventricosum]|uniref:Uncharacterized protein n=1 Tax=Ensete ventricosum TaxID=4639 RepID=A0A426YXZ5_ENSVE|nr:hypothetical protein B296_00047760 [Ensete ventricosum]
MKEAVVLSTVEDLMAVDFDDDVNLAEKEAVVLSTVKGATNCGKHWWWSFPIAGGVTEQIVEVTSIRGRSGRCSVGGNGRLMEEKATGSRRCNDRGGRSTTTVKAATWVAAIVGAG